MSPHDQQRLTKMIRDFIDGTGFDPPFHVICIGSNGACSIAMHTTRRDVRQVCGHNASRLSSPITVVVVSEDGGGKSAKIEIVAAEGTMQ